MTLDGIFCDFAEMFNRLISVVWTNYNGKSMYKTSFSDPRPTSFDISIKGVQICNIRIRDAAAGLQPLALKHDVNILLHIDVVSMAESVHDLRYQCSLKPINLEAFDVRAREGILVSPSA